MSCWGCVQLHFNPITPLMPTFLSFILPWPPPPPLYYTVHQTNRWLFLVLVQYWCYRQVYFEPYLPPLPAYLSFILSFLPVPAAKYTTQTGDCCSFGPDTMGVDRCNLSLFHPFCTRSSTSSSFCAPNYMVHHSDSRLCVVWSRYILKVYYPFGVLLRYQSI